VANSSGPAQASAQAASHGDESKLPFWKRSHYLDRMTLRQLIFAYFQHYTIISYLAIAAAALVVFALWPAGVLQTLACVVAAALVYPLVWHLLHQYVLHGQWPYKIKPLAATWKRIHYDHHQDPNHLEVLFGALHTTVPTVALATIPVGWLIGGVGAAPQTALSAHIGGAAVAFATGILTTCYYEFMHCIQHLAFKPKWGWVQHMKQRHNEHHYVDEDGNFGITNYWWDHILGTYYEKKDRPGRSPTVFNLGYTEEVSRKYPWVKELSGGIASDHPRRRALANARKAVEARQAAASDEALSAEAIEAHAAEAIGLRPDA
jgi:sterol desaturase/sphingolipid hydroxylase (fatty acid hydroxylase superfamily)